MIEHTHGAFFGSALDFHQCEILAIANIDRRLLAHETALYGQKWFDYRPLHPTLATYLFAHHYNRAYGAFMGQYFDHKKRFMAAFKGKDVMAARERKSFWKLRQKCDELGVRYDFFCRVTMEWCAINGWKQPPRPAHAATNAELLVYVANRWAQECRGRIQWAHDPRYTTRNWCGAPDQAAYEAHVLDAIKSKPLPQYALHTALYVFDALRIEAAIEKLPESAVDQAVDFAAKEVSKQ